MTIMPDRLGAAPLAAAPYDPVFDRIAIAGNPSIPYAR